MTKDRINTPVTNTTTGEVLKKRRLDRGLSLRDVSQATKIRSEFLEALENNDYTGFSSEVHIKGFLKNYAKYLGLDLEKVMAIYRREYQQDEIVSDASPQPDNSKLPMILSRKKLLVSVSALVVLLLGAYFLEQLAGVMAPPLLTVTAPFELTADHEGEIFIQDDTIRLSGRTSPRTIVYLNAEALPLDGDQQFSTGDIPLPNSSNTLVLNATNQFGRTSTIKIVLTKGAAPVTEIKIKIEIINQPSALRLETDGEEAFNDRAFPGEDLEFNARESLTISSKTPENIILTLNDQEFRLTEESHSFRLEDGEISE